jgi:hypothetical protein
MNPTGLALASLAVGVVISLVYRGRPPRELSASRR